MFVRVTRTSTAPDKIPQAIAVYQEQLMPEARKMRGFTGAILSVDRATGAGISATFWDSEEAMRASDQDAEALRARATQTTGARVTEIDRFEVVMQERTAPPAANTFVRVNTVNGSPDKVDDVIRFIREQSLPLVKQQQGFRAAVMGVNRQTGRAFVTTSWATAADREASDAALRDSRRQAGQAAGGDQVQVELYEVAFAEMSQAAATNVR